MPNGPIGSARTRVWRGCGDSTNLSRGFLRVPARKSRRNWRNSAALDGPVGVRLRTNRDSPRHLGPDRAPDRTARSSRPATKPPGGRRTSRASQRGPLRVAARRPASGGSRSTGRPVPFRVGRSFRAVRGSPGRRAPPIGSARPVPGRGHRDRGLCLDCRGASVDAQRKGLRRHSRSPPLPAVGPVAGKEPRRRFGVSAAGISSGTSPPRCSGDPPRSRCAPCRPVREAAAPPSGRVRSRPRARR